MFGDHAPIWRFLGRVGATQDPHAARDADSGTYLMEVFPALALPALVPSIWDRRRAAKYNPAARLYEHSDWILVAKGVAEVAERLGVAQVASFARGLSSVKQPRKADQDRLDAVICLLIGLIWRRRQPLDCLVLGDAVSGYIVTPVSAETEPVLRNAALKHSVKVDAEWENAPVGTPVPCAKEMAPGSAVDLAGPPKAALVSGQMRGPRAQKAKATISANELREFLIQTARARGLVTYGDVAGAFGFAWTQGFGASLTAALRALDLENTQRGEPSLMALVVNKQSRLPGQGYYDMLGEGSADTQRRRELLAAEVRRCAEWDWG